MVKPTALRPLLALILALYVIVLVSAFGQASPLDAPVAAAPLDAGVPGVDAHTELTLPDAPVAVGVDPVQTVTDAALAQTLVTRAAGLESQAGITSLLAPRSDARAAGAGAAPTGGAFAVQGQEAEMVAAGTLGALATFALKAEPVRRGLFLLALPLYSRLRRSDLLDNAVRERIYRAVERSPGVSIIQVCRAAKVGWGTAVYHLQRLERDRMIASRRDGQYRRFFLNGHAPTGAGPDLAAKALAHPLAARIAAFVAANPGVAQKQVCEALAIAPPLASKWLGRLLEAGLITSRREWKLVRYAPTAALEQALAPRAPVAVGAAAVPA